MNRILLLLFLIYGGITVSQTLPLAELLKYPYYPYEQVGDSLIKRGWEIKKVEFVSDSNYVRRVWSKSRPKDNVKTYVIYYEFTKDTSENYIIYQFSEKQSFQDYKSDLKKKGFKIMTKKSRLKMKNTDIITYNDKEDIFYNDKKNTLVIVEDVFLFGLNCFLIYTYKSSSAIARYILKHH